MTPGTASDATTSPMILGAIASSLWTSTASMRSPSERNRVGRSWQPRWYGGWLPCTIRRQTSSYSSHLMECPRRSVSRPERGVHLKPSHTSSGPNILAGDLNSQENTEVMQILDGLWTEASPPNPLFVDGQGRPQSRVDYVLVRPAGAWRVLESRVVDAPVASDHEPVLAVLEWTGAR